MDDPNPQAVRDLYMKLGEMFNREAPRMDEGVCALLLYARDALVAGGATREQAAALAIDILQKATEMEIIKLS